MKKYVEIQSEVTVTVPRDLGFKNLTKKDSDIPNRLKVQPIWSKSPILLLKGKHTYPREVADWPIIKNMIKDKLVTIGNETDDKGDCSIVLEKNVREAEKNHEEFKPKRAYHKHEEMKDTRDQDSEPKPESKDVELDDIAQ